MPNRSGEPCAARCHRRRPGVAVPGTYPERARAHRPRSAPAKSLLHRAEPPLIITVDAVRANPQQHLHRVPGPLGHQRRRGPGVQPRGNTGMPEVIGPAGQRGGELRLREGPLPRFLQDPPQRGRQVKAAPHAAPLARPPPGSALGTPARHGRADSPDGAADQSRSRHAAGVLHEAIFLAARLSSSRPPPQGRPGGRRCAVASPALTRWPLPRILAPAGKTESTRKCQ